MPHQLTTAGNVVAPIEQAINYTHVKIISIEIHIPINTPTPEELTQYPAIGYDFVGYPSTTVVWAKCVVENGRFKPIQRNKTVVEHPATIARMFAPPTPGLSRSDDMEKLVLDYLIELGEIGSGTLITSLAQPS